MKRLAWIAIGALLLAPANAEAAKKTILRFKKPAKEAPPAPPKETEGSGLLLEKSPLLGGSSQEGWLLRPEGEEGRLLGEMVERPDWFGKKVPEKPGKPKGADTSARSRSGDDDANLPGSPVETEAAPAPPPRTQPVIRRGVRYVAPPPSPSPLPKVGEEGRTVPTGVPSAPAPPERYAPFTYQTTPPDSKTPRWYTPSVAPRGEARLPAAAPIGTGQPPVTPRVLPRLAPYGTALPPDQTEPPAALPR